MRKRIDIKGKRFGKLVAIKDTGVSKNQKAVWECVCDCGKIVFVAQDKLKSGHTTSCGCKKRNGVAHKTHGMTCTRLYRIWKSMKKRTTNPHSSQYRDYGGRGIEICEEWKNSFEQFRDWSMENGYRSNLTIDRIDNNKGYSPNNCRYVTMKTQANNTRRNRFIRYGGEERTVSEWAEKTGIKRSTLESRLKRGWSTEKALTTPVQTKDCPLLPEKK